MNRTFAATLALILFLFTTQLLAQGLYWESTMKMSALGDKERHSQSSYMPKMLREVSDDHVTIIRLDKQIIYTIDTKDTTYSEMTFEELGHLVKGAGKKMNSEMAKMQEELKNLPEDQRKMVEKMMGGNMPGASSEATVARAEIQNTGEKKMIGGLACGQYKVMRNGEEFMTVWATKDMPKGFEAMKSDLKELRDRMSALIPFEKAKAAMEAMKSLDGFPMQIESEWMTNTVTKIEKHKTEASAFEVPAGFKKKKSSLMDELKGKPKEEKEE